MYVGLMFNLCCDDLNVSFFSIFFFVFRPEIPMSVATLLLQCVPGKRESIVRKGHAKKGCCVGPLRGSFAVLTRSCRKRVRKTTAGSLRSGKRQKTTLQAKEKNIEVI